jgi:hypothetical protein
MNGGDDANALIQDGIPNIGIGITSLQNFSKYTLYIFSLVCLSPAPNNASIFRILIYTHTPQINNNSQSASNFVTSFIELEKNPALVETRKQECYLVERSRSLMVIIKVWKLMLSNLLQNAHEAGCKVLVSLCISCHRVKEGTNRCTHHTRVLVT